MKLICILCGKLTLTNDGNNFKELRIICESCQKELYSEEEKELQKGENTDEKSMLRM